MVNKLSTRLINVLNQSGFNGNYFIPEYEYLEILEKYKKFDIYLSDSAKELLKVLAIGLSHTKIIPFQIEIIHMKLALIPVKY